MNVGDVKKGRYKSELGAKSLMEITHRFRRGALLPIAKGKGAAGGVSPVRVLEAPPIENFLKYSGLVGDK